MIAVHCAAHGLKLRGTRWHHQMKQRPAKAFFARVREAFLINALS